MKKIIAIITLCCVIFTGCGAQSEPIPTESAVNAESVVSISSKLVNEERITPSFLANKESSCVTVECYDDPALYMQYAVDYINASEAWGEVDQKETVTIAVIDTGVDYTHEDLVNRVSAEKGYDFVNDDNDAMDDNGHGTHVAGIIAAEGNNGVGVVGMVGNLDVEIIPIKALGANGEGMIEDIFDAISYAISLDVDIINLSLGTTKRSADFDMAIEIAIREGIIVVVAAGNDGSRTGFASPVGVEGVIAVGATTQTGVAAEFSNYGMNIDIGAPGDGIISTMPNNEYAIQSGTSMATPIITSAVAILLAENPDLTYGEVTELLCDNTTQLTKGGKNENMWFGIVDIYATLQSM